ncbi:MAG: DUF1566 domain-containing protein [Thermodesulfobacteriota bacterium]
MKKLLLILLIMLVAPAGLCLAADPDIRLPHTDGSDAPSGRITWPPQRFADNGNGTVSDNLTGLMWMREANCIDTYDLTVGSNIRLTGMVTWAEALSFAQMVNSGAVRCGVTTTYTDWRVPNRREIWSLTDFSLGSTGGTSSSLPAGHPFINDESIYWSSTVYSGPAIFDIIGDPLPPAAWVYNLHDPYLLPEDRTDYHFVWLCRGGN